MSDAPFASTSSGNGLEPKRSSSAINKRPATAAGSRRKGKGRGRQMMLKIFYALNSPRFPSASSTPQPQQQPNPSSSNALSPDFLAVLDPALAPSPDPIPTPGSSTSSGPANTTTSQYSCMARLSTPVWVQMVGPNRRSDNPAGAQSRNPQFGRVTLKTCLSAICISRPELVIDSTKDFSVSAVDPYESLNQQQQAASHTAFATGPNSGSAASGRYEPQDALVEGKGMLSWTLAEKKEGTTMVCGRVIGPEDGFDARRPSKRRKIEAGSDNAGGGEGELSDDDDSESDEPEETLEIWLQLTERDAFTQGQFLDCLRSYHNPIQQIQSQLSELNSSPPKLRDSFLTGSVPPASEGLLPPHSTSSGDPIKPKRPRERVQPPAATKSAPFATSATMQGSSPAELHPLAETVEGIAAAAAAAAQSATSAPPPTAANGLQDPRTLALLEQLLPTLTGRSAGALDSNGLDVSQAQALLPAIETLAKYYGIGMAAPAAGNNANLAAPAAIVSSGEQAQQSIAGSATALPAASMKNAASTASTSKRPVQSTERFVVIDVSNMTALQKEQVGKQNPRDPRGGCANCKRRKSTTWHEGRDKAGTMTSVCNACGTFFNKNGYHRTKAPAAPSSSAPGPRSGVPGTSPPRSRAKVAGGRPLQGRLTATCEADLAKRSKAKKTRTSPIAGGAASIFGTGLVPPLSPSKHVGPRSPSLSFAAAFGHHPSPRKTMSQSSPGRSPRMRYRKVSNPFAATSPVRGSQARRPDRGNDAALAYESDGEERGPNPLEFGSLFGMGTGSPSPARTTKLPNGKDAAGNDMPSYLLTASPGTALDRILNETNIGSISAYDGGASGKRGSQGLPDASAMSDFSFFLQQPGSPTFGKSSTSPSGKENARPTVATSSTDPAQPITDADSFETVLSSLRRDFNNRLSSNALTAPSSPAPSSPCVLPRTSTATPGSKGKAPLSSGRPAPSIVDSFLDELVPAFALDASTEAGGHEKTPASDSDAWSPLNTQADQDATIRLEDGVPRPFDLSQPTASKSTRPARRAAFIPAHLLAPSDATDVFDLGSLPPSSPPMLPSDAFPTPSDFDGVTPSADGGEQPTSQQSMLEAVAQTVAREPNAETRQAMIALLQSLGAGGTSGNPSNASFPQSIGSDEAKVQLDRDTVTRLLGLISAHETSTDAGPEPKVETVAAASSSSHSTMTALNAPAPVVTGSQQMDDLYHDLFANPPF
ncbi:hypothetical protein JCM10908_001571 [Rhodotorula pacifica]|uniref:GATA-type transcription factor n=1 Tax=Rhodotorula pacifica TaxID=1495444 RepID=UPI00317C4D02